MVQISVQQAKYPAVVRKLFGESRFFHWGPYLRCVCMRVPTVPIYRPSN